jgi:hypothetical protein
MMDPILIMSLAALAATSVITAALLSGWRGWLKLKTVELDKLGERNAPTGAVNTRIELADLKERLRKLEAIAAGVDL